MLDLHRERDVRLDARIDELDIGSDVAVPLGLILNEFATNSLKYAFDGEAGVIAIRAHKLDSGRIRVRISDNGKGLPAERRRPGSGTGMALIEGLARQIRAEVEGCSRGGTALRLEFDPMPKRRP